MKKVDNVDRVLGKYIKIARLEIGMTQEELGEKVGMHRSSIVSLEAGQKGVYCHDLHKISTILNKPMCYFMSGEIECEVLEEKLNKVTAELEGMRLRVKGK